MKEVAEVLSLKTVIKRTLQNVAVICVQIAFLAVPFLLINFSFSTFLGQNNESTLDPKQVNEKSVQKPELESSNAQIDNDIEELIVDVNSNVLLVNNERP
ncbi:MAG: hypothetical protein D8M58_04790 [Calditrichaeota bacterium]|nr:MAG: hypothetical protein DWQ03_02285 [Calditrichota bacterium]MBL1204689.1 hypothetical protein [Calditrichota bacterium]NOG44517.1 hypothetical protein [Calditrichota bacterium]